MGTALLLLGSAVYTALVLGRYFGRRQEGGQNRRLQSRKVPDDRNPGVSVRPHRRLRKQGRSARSLSGRNRQLQHRMVCAQIAVDTILDQFEPYQGLNAPAYF